MEVMVLFPQNKKVYDFIRRKWVEATPEEMVRQKLLFFMVEDLGYPKQSLTVEKKLSEVVQNVCVPNRRLDILCFSIKTMQPLLLVECKATPIRDRMFVQLMGYNTYIDAPLICLANYESIFVMWKQGMIQRGIPTYSELVDVYI